MTKCKFLLLVPSLLVVIHLACAVLYGAVHASDKSNLRSSIGLRSSDRGSFIQRAEHFIGSVGPVANSVGDENSESVTAMQISRQRNVRRKNCSGGKQEESRGCCAREQHKNIPGLGVTSKETATRPNAITVESAKTEDVKTLSVQGTSTGTMHNKGSSHSSAFTTQGNGEESNLHALAGHTNSNGKESVSPNVNHKESVAARFLRKRSVDSNINGRESSIAGANSRESIAINVNGKEGISTNAGGNEKDSSCVCAKVNKKKKASTSNGNGSSKAKNSHTLEVTSNQIASKSHTSNRIGNPVLGGPIVPGTEHLVGDKGVLRKFGDWIFEATRDKALAWFPTLGRIGTAVDSYCERHPWFTAFAFWRGKKATPEEAYHALPLVNELGIVVRVFLFIVNFLFLYSVCGKYGYCCSKTSWIVKLAFSPVSCVCHTFFKVKIPCYYDDYTFSLCDKIGACAKFRILQPYVLPFFCEMIDFHSNGVPMYEEVHRHRDEKGVLRGPDPTLFDSCKSVSTIAGKSVSTVAAGGKSASTVAAAVKIESPSVVNQGRSTAGSFSVSADPTAFRKNAAEADEEKNDEDDVGSPKVGGKEWEFVPRKGYAVFYRFFGWSFGRLGAIFESAAKKIGFIDKLTENRFDEKCFTEFGQAPFTMLGVCTRDCYTDYQKTFVGKDVKFETLLESIKSAMREEHQNDLSDTAVDLNRREYEAAYFHEWKRQKNMCALLPAFFNTFLYCSACSPDDRLGLVISSCLCMEYCKRRYCSYDACKGQGNIFMYCCPKFMISWIADVTDPKKLAKASSAIIGTTNNSNENPSGTNNNTPSNQQGEQQTESTLKEKSWWDWISGSGQTQSGNLESETVNQPSDWTQGN